MTMIKSVSLMAAFGFVIACGGGSADSSAPQTPTNANAPAAAATTTSADADGDGIPDSADKCPDKKEDGQAPDPKDGCPKQ